MLFWKALKEIDMIDRIPIKNEPRLMEAVVQQMQVQLGAGLS